VPYSFVDLNGHMNNSRYFDLAEDCIGAAAAGALLKEIAVEYQNEARLAETLSLRWGLQDTGNPEEQFYILSGRTARDVFRMSLRYE
jgi:acyl-ACP thioesterase